MPTKLFSEKLRKEMVEKYEVLLQLKFLLVWEVP